MTEENSNDLFLPSAPHQTSPLQVDVWELEADMGKIEQQWEPLYRILSSEMLFSIRAPAVSGWSVGEQAGHSVLVLQLVATIIKRLLERPDNDADKEPAGFTRQIFERGAFPRGVAKAPKHVLPFDRTRRDFLALLEGARENWRALQSRLSEIQKCRGRYPHFVFGYLRPSDWTRFCAGHTAHHLKIAADILDHERLIPQDFFQSPKCQPGSD